MQRAMVLAGFLVVGALALVPSVSAEPLCVSVSLDPNPVRVECDEFQEQLCYKTIGRLIPMNCEEWGPLP